jgi:hypothetical protein
LLPMANGQRIASPLFADKISGDDARSMLGFIELFLRHRKGMVLSDLEVKHLDKLAEEGYDLRTPQGLRKLIRQFYTHLAHIDENQMLISATVAPGDAGSPTFQFDVTKNGDIIIGWTYSGMKPQWANLTQAGTLSEAFVRAFTDGIQNRPRHVVYTDPAEGIKGLNDFSEIRVPSLRSGKLVFRTYGSYNAFVKSFTSTMVYGTHKVDGRYIYSANPQMILDYPMEEPEQRIQARDPEAEREETPVEDPGVEEVRLEDLGMPEGMEGLFGLSSSKKTIPGLPASAENLTEMRNFTPDASGSVSKALKDLDAAGSSVVAPEHIPFIKCT